MSNTFTKEELTFTAKEIKMLREQLGATYISVRDNKISFLLGSNPVTLENNIDRYIETSKGQTFDYFSIADYVASIMG